MRRLGNEPFFLPLQRAFRQLDWRKEGWLARAIVEEQCHRAQNKLKVKIERAEIAKVIKAEDEKGGRPDHHIDEPEFISIVLSIREELRSALERQSVSKGLLYAVEEIERWKNRRTGYAISKHWSPRVDQLKKSIVIIFTRTFGGDVTANDAPLAWNATNAVYLATKSCVTSVDSAVNKLRPVLSGWEISDREEVDEVLNTTIDTVALFHRFESPKGVDTYHWLDEFIDLASTLPLSFFSESGDCPVQQATGLVTNLWSVLDRILGLVNDIGFFAYGHAVLTKWRESRILA